MTTPTLASLTLQTLQNYRAAANQAVRATRAGGHRLLGAMNGALENTVYPRTARIAPVTTARISEVRSRMSGMLVKGIDQMAERTGQFIDQGSATAVAGVHKVVDAAAGVQSPLVASGLHTAARLTMPGAQVALAVSDKLAQGASALAEAAGARPVKKAARRATAGAKRMARTVKTRAKAAVKPVVRRARKAA